MFSSFLSRAGRVNDHRDHPCLRSTELIEIRTCARTITSILGAARRRISNTRAVNADSFVKTVAACLLVGSYVHSWPLVTRVFTADAAR